MFFVLKIGVSAITIALVSELAKRFSLIAAILASLPIISILSFIFLYAETRDIDKVISLSNGIFWAVLPSLLFFIALPVLLKSGLSFPVALAISMLLMAIAYAGYATLLGSVGIKL